MGWMRVIAIVLAAAGAGGCGPKRTNQCPGNVAHGCVAGEVCSFDRQRGCQVCECRPFDQTPSGHDPDDPTPPIPVH
jgi:hypothetical protein